METEDSQKNLIKDDSFLTGASIEQAHYLNPNDRPLIVNAKIDEVFQSLSCKETSTWTMNGEEPTYDLLGIKENELAKHIILNSDSSEFNFLDLGAANFQWGEVY